MKHLLHVLLSVIAVVALAACSGDSPSPAPSPAPTPVVIGVPSSTVTGGITLATAAGVSLALDFGIKQDSTRARIGGYIYTDATLTLQLANGAALSPDDYQAYLIANGIKGDAQYAQFVPTAVSLYKTLIYPKIQGNANAAAVTAYLVAFAQGLQNGAAVYAPTTVIKTSASPAATTYVQPPARIETAYVSPLMRVRTDLRPVYGWRDAYDVRLASR